GLAISSNTGICTFAQWPSCRHGGIVSQFPPNSLFSLANGLAPNQKSRQGLGLAATLLTSPPPTPMGLGLLGRAMAPPQTTLLSGLASLGIAPAPATAPMWIYVTRRFQTFLGKLDLTSLQLADGLTKIRGVVSCLNAAYYGHNSD